MKLREPGRGNVPDRARTLREIRDCKRMHLWNTARLWEYHLRWLDWWEDGAPHPGPAPSMGGIN